MRMIRGLLVMMTGAVLGAGVARADTVFDLTLRQVGPRRRMLGGVR